MIETKGSASVSAKTEAVSKDLWATPQESVDGFFSYVENKGLVTSGLSKLDVCANKHNRKCERFITENRTSLGKPPGGMTILWLVEPTLLRTFSLS